MSHEPPNPFDEAKDKLITDLNAQLGLKEEQVKRYRAALEALAQQIRFTGTSASPIPPGVQIQLADMLHFAEKTLRE